MQNESVISVRTSAATQTNEFTVLQNSTTTADEDFNSRLNYAVLALTPLIFVIAVGNIMVITLVGLDRKLRSSTNCFLTSLAVTDMLVALIVMPLSLAMIVNNYNWPFSDELCGLWVMLDVFFSTCSILHLCMISFDRYMALAQPFSSRYPGKTSSGSARSSVVSLGKNKKQFLSHAGRRIFFVWSVALGIAIPIPILGKIDRENLFVGQMCAINIAEFQIYGSLAAFFLPLVIMFILYTLTIRTLTRQAQLVSNIMVQNSPPNAFVYSSQNRPFYNSLQKESAQNQEHLKSWSKIRQAVTADGNGTIFSRDAEVTNADFANETCRKCQQKSVPSDGTRAQTGSWRKALRMIRNTFHRIQRGRKRTYSAAKNTLNNNEKCTCRNNRNDIECNKSIENTPESLLLRQQSRSYRARHGKASSSFKTSAMASINNEQRASKVLGLIFVLFCVFWCPFFITNVTSRLCSTCDQEVMGNLMNWFVWVGYVSSGVNPCVYTMFSRRFRRTFFLVMKGKFSDINKESLPHRPYSKRTISTFPIRNSKQSATITYPSTKSFPSSLDMDGFVKSKNALKTSSHRNANTSKPKQINLKIWRKNLPTTSTTQSQAVGQAVRNMI